MPNFRKNDPFIVRDDNGWSR